MGEKQWHVGGDWWLAPAASPWTPAFAGVTLKLETTR
jgi:hypothetical protein